jgi:hypothetical protein
MNKKSLKDEGLTEESSTEESSLERLPYQIFLPKMWCNTSNREKKNLCGNCLESCIVTDEYNKNKNTYLCMICMGFGYQCRNFRFCHNYYNYIDIRSGVIAFPNNNDQYCYKCKDNKCFLDVHGTHTNKARLGLANQYNYCYPCFKEDCKYQASIVDNHLLIKKECIRKKEYSYYFKYIVKNNITKTLSEYCNYCYSNCNIIDKDNIFQHKELVDISTLKKKYKSDYNIYKCDCYNKSCLE